ncbi:hypothetical protein [Roseovarius sp.]|jgi:hypothetical protein
MAEPFETLREVGVALDGFRQDVIGQFTTLKWIIGGVTALGIGVAALLFNKVDRLEEAAARHTAILERIESSVNDVASDASSIRETVQTASISTDPNTFDGYVGVRLKDAMSDQQIKALSGGEKFSEGWIFLPRHMEDFVSPDVPAQAEHE